MKKIFYPVIFFLLLIPAVTFAQPANDACANATSFGSLPAPTACPAGSTSGFNQGASVTLTGQTNVGATSSAPYPYLAACPINYFSPPKDVWYSFVATGFQTTITLSGGTGTLTNPTITMWEGSCAGLIGQGCSTGSGGAATLTVYQTVIGQTYYVQVAGADSTQTGTFTIAAACANNCAGCLQQSFITATPEPVNGGYAPGQTVEFCYTVTKWDEGAANWLHGIAVTFGNGWDTSTLVIDSIPPACTTTSPGAHWGYYPAGQTSSFTGVYFGPGFYFETSAGSSCACINTNPGDNYGDYQAAQGTCNPTFCLSITASATDTAGSNLNVTFKTSGDGESGSWGSPGCNPDPPVTAFAVSSCALPRMGHLDANCHLPNGVDTAYAPIGHYAPYIYHWSTGYVDTTSGFSVIRNLAPGIYTVTVINSANCIATNSDTIIDSTYTYGGPKVQYVSCPSLIDSIVMSAVGTGSWSALSTNPATTIITNPNASNTGISGFTLFGTYKYVWTVGCATDTISIVVTSRPNAGPDVSTCLNGTATMAGIGVGTWAPLAANSSPTVIANLTSPTTTITGFTVAGGTYGYTWTVGNCIDTAYVLIPTFTSNAVIRDTVLCRNQTTQLTATANPPGLGPFTFTWLDSADVIQPHSGITATVPVLAPTIYIVQVATAGGCILYDTLHVAVAGAAPVVHVSASDNSVCPGDTVTLNSIVFAENLVSCGTVDTCPNNNLLFSVAVNNDTSSSTGNNFGFTNVYCSPFMGSYNSYKVQYLFRKSELNAAGLSSGSITDISFFVKQINSTAGYDTFSISMGCTNLDSLTGFVNNLLEVVPPQYGPNAVYPNLGWTPFPFTHYYNWDGASNIVIQVCYTISSSLFSQDDFVSYSTTPYSGSSITAGDNFTSGVNGCALSNGSNFYSVNSTRANIKFGMCAPNVLAYNWTPSTLLCDTCPVTQVIARNDTTYTLTVNDNGCANDTFIRVTINPYLALNATPDTTLCGNDTVQLNVMLANPPISQCVQGYSVASIPYAAISGVATVIPPVAYLSSSGFSYSTDNGTAGPFPIGFNFPFYCNTDSQFYVNSNGWITFQNPYPATQVSQEYTAQTFPPSAADLNPQKVIELMMGDYYLSNSFGTGGGNISYFVVGTAPNRILVVDFNNMEDATFTYTTTGQIQLHETSGIIDIMIASSSYAGTNHTTGVKDSTGLGTAAPGMNNQPYVVTQPVAWRFTPQYGPSVAVAGALWSPNQFISNDSLINPYVYPPSSQTYYVNTELIINQFTHPTYCAVHDSVRINVTSFTDSVTATPQTICPGDTTQLRFSSQATVSSIQWTPAAGLSSSTIVNPLATVLDTTTYYVTATSAAGCHVTDSVKIYTIPTPQLVLSPDSTVCYNDSVLLTLAGTYSNYQWYRVDSATGIRTLVSSGTTNNSYYAHPQGYYVLGVTSPGASCKYFTNLVKIDSFIRPVVLVNVVGSTQLCQGQDVVLETNQGLTNIQWIPASYGSQTSFPVTSSGTFSYTAIDANGCPEASNTVTVTVTPLPIFALNNYKNPICAGNIDTLVATSVPAGATITWSGQPAGDTLLANTGGAYQIQASLNGCIADTTIVLASAPSPVVTLPASYSTCTADTLVAANVTGGTPPYNYVWSNGATGATVTDTTSGSSTYSLTVSDANNCTAASNQQTITISTPFANVTVLPVSDTIFIRDTAIFIAVPTNSSGTYSYLWSGTTTTTILQPGQIKTDVIGDSLGVDTVHLLVTDPATGCTYNTYAVVHVVDFGAFAMPTAFTPNGDGMNDYFYPAFNGPNSPAHVTAFRIYNRWGQLIYNSPNAPGWDGNYGGTQQPSETYLYLGQDKLRKGKSSVT